MVVQEGTIDKIQLGQGSSPEDRMMIMRERMASRGFSVLAILEGQSVDGQVLATELGVEVVAYEELGEVLEATKHESVAGAIEIQRSDGVVPSYELEGTKHHYLDILSSVKATPDIKTTGRLGKVCVQAGEGLAAIAIIAEPPRLPIMQVVGVKQVLTKAN